MKIKLISKTRKGQNKIDQHGEFWIILKIEKRIACCGGNEGLLIIPINGNENAKRWIAKINDCDFNFQEMD